MLIYIYLVTTYLNIYFSEIYIDLHFLVSLFFESETTLYIYEELHFLTLF